MTQVISEPDELLYDPNPLDRIIAGTEKLLNIGNENLKKSAVLSCASTVNADPDSTIHLIVEGPPGIGKTSGVKSILNLLINPEKLFHRARITPKTFDHLEENLDNKIVFVEEQTGNEASYSTKILLSEHKISVDVVESEDGRHRVNTKTVSAKNTAFLTTTTRVSFDKELESRVIRVYPENSGDYREEVLNSILDGVEVIKPNQIEQAEDIIQPFREAFDALERYYVEIPFAKEIFSYQLLSPIQDLFRILKKILAVIQSHTLLCQYNREKKGGNVITATIDDYRKVKPLLEQLLNPPSPDRLKLKSSFGDNEFSLDNIMELFEIKESMAYMKVKAFKEQEMIIQLAPRTYRLNKIELPDPDPDYTIPAIPTVQENAEEKNNSNESNDSSSSNPSNDSNNSNNVDIDDNLGSIEPSEEPESLEFQNDLIRQKPAYEFDLPEAEYE